jgi:integrase/recombinase XerD
MTVAKGTPPNQGIVRGHLPTAPCTTGLAPVVRATVRLWRQYHLGYDQTKYVVERARRALALEPPQGRRRSVERLDRCEVERLIQTAYRTRSRYGLMVKPLFLTGARVSEFVQLRVEDLRLDGDLPQVHLARAKGGASRYVPILPSLAQEVRTHLQGRRHGYLFESNRHTHYAPRTVQAMVAACAREAGLTKRVHPHLLRHSIATLLLDSGQVPIDQVQQFLGHRRLATTQIYAATSVQALGASYLRALGPWG